MKLSSFVIFGVLRLLFVCGYNVNRETSSPAFKQAIERSMKQSNKVLFYVAVGVSVVMHVDAGSLATGPRTTCLQDPSKYPKIHTFGNTGLLGAIHAALAPLETKLIDFSAFFGENVRITIAKGLRQNIGKANVLDLCFCIGMSTRPLQGACQDAAVILGVNTSKDMIDMAELLSSDLEPAKFLVGTPKHAFNGSCSPHFLIGNAEETNLLPEVFDSVTIMYSFDEVPHHGRYHLKEACHLLADSCTLAVIDIMPNYEPSPTMLAGEPNVLENKAKIKKQPKVILGFITSRYEEDVAEHVCLWDILISLWICFFGNIFFKVIARLLPLRFANANQAEQNNRPPEKISKFKLLVISGVTPILCIAVIGDTRTAILRSYCKLFTKIGVVGGLCDFIKLIYRKQRPNFIDLVAHDPLDAEQSMPSAHTCLALTSMLHLSFFLMENNMTIFTVIPLSVSLLVANSRVNDRYHDWLDISVGMLIGLASTLL